MTIPFSKVSMTLTGRKITVKDEDGNWVEIDETEEMLAQNRVFASGWIAAGPETEAFEQEFADYVGVKYAIFTNSCTSALKMAYKWAKEGNIKSFTTGSSLVTIPKNTFCATYSSAIEMGLRVAAYTGNPKSGQIAVMLENPELGVAVENGAYGNRVNMHYGGIKDETPCLIEDSAHRIEPNDPLVGKIRCYSFYATKNMTTGSGGMFVTNDKEIYERARLYWKDGLTTSTLERSRGADNYVVSTMAGGYDGNDLAAAIGRVQLKRLPTFTDQRNRIRDTYNAAFGQDWRGNHLYPYVCRSIDELKALRAFLKEEGITCSYHYPTSDGQYRADWLGLSLPIYPDLSDNENTYVIDAILKFRKQYGTLQNETSNGILSGSDT